MTLINIPVLDAIFTSRWITYLKSLDNVIRNTFTCKAWVNFNGTNTVTVRANGNISTVGDAGVGLYNIYFDTPLEDANYCVNISLGGTAGALIARVVDEDVPRTASMFKIKVTGASGTTAVDCAQINISVFR